MKKINIMFERDETLEDIDILIRASDEDKEVKALFERIDPNRHTAVTASDENGALEIIPVSDIILLSVNGKQVREGEQILIGGMDKYIPLCRKHYSDGRISETD